MRNRFLRTLLSSACVLAWIAPPAVPADAAPEPVPLEAITHIIVVYQENWSFDGLYGRFPGASGIGDAGAAVRQVDAAGQPYQVLPQPLDTRVKPTPAPDTRFPADLPVQPFDAARFVAPDATTGDLVHRFYQEQAQINGGRMDRFVSAGNSGGLPMSYYDASDMPEGRLARRHTMLDRFFHAAFGGSFLNHVWLACACTPRWPDAPEEVLARVDAEGRMLRDGEATPDRYAVNTVMPRQQPRPPGISEARTLPPLAEDTIGDRLSEKGVSWAWFAGGWDEAVAGRPPRLFQFHHQPYVYFARYAEGTPARAAHLRDEAEFVSSLRNGTLPQVSFVKPLGDDNEHPGYTSLLRGQRHVADLVRAVQESPYWAHVAIVITYDENGGRWDHVPPPAVDRWGPGTRVPAMVISPYARAGAVDHTVYETTSILRFIERRFELIPLGSRDATAGDLGTAFDAAALRRGAQSAAVLNQEGSKP